MYVGKEWDGLSDGFKQKMTLEQILAAYGGFP